MDRLYIADSLAVSWTSTTLMHNIPSYDTILRIYQGSCLLI